MEGGFALRPHYPARKIKGTDFPGETQSTELDFVKFGLPPFLFFCQKCYELLPHKFLKMRV